MWRCSSKLPIWRDLVSHNHKENNNTIQIRIHYHKKCTLFSNRVNQPLIPSRLISLSSILVTKMKNNKILSYKPKTLKWIQTQVNGWRCDQQIKHQSNVKEENGCIKMKMKNEKNAVTNNGDNEQSWMEKLTGKSLPLLTMKSSFKTALQKMIDGDGITKLFGAMVLAGRRRVSDSFNVN